MRRGRVDLNRSGVGCICDRDRQRSLAADDVAAHSVLERSNAILIADQVVAVRVECPQSGQITLAHCRRVDGDD